jgi:hypothetical protein
MFDGLLTHTADAPLAARYIDSDWYWLMDTVINTITNRMSSLVQCRHIEHPTRSSLFSVARVSQRDILDIFLRMRVLKRLLKLQRRH